MFTENDFQTALDHFETADPVIYQLLQQTGYRPPPPSRPLFPTLVGIIIGQRIRFTKARDLRRKLYLHLETDQFTPEQILNLGLDGLTNIIGLDKTPAETILRVAQEPPVSLQQLENQTVKIKGIGPWTVKNTKLMMSFYLPEDNLLADILLWEDLIVRRGLKALYGITKESQVAPLIEKWRPYAGVVTWYLLKAYT